MIVNLLLIFIFLNQFIEIKAGNNGFFRRKRDAPASNSSRQEERPILNNINSNSFPNDVNDVSASLQHLQTNEAEQPSQNSHVQPEESHGISQVAQTTATINSRVGLRPPNPDIVNPDPDFSAPEGDHPMPGIDNIEMPQGQASSSSDLASDGSNNKDYSHASTPFILIVSIHGSESEKRLAQFVVARLTLLTGLAVLNRLSGMTSFSNRWTNIYYIFERVADW
uniref:RING-type domain-containing protein n=1 Tax=Globodera rostochiensis TaxID=31243 RepID=A0A914IEL1_GLORO